MYRFKLAKNAHIRLGKRGEKMAADFLRNRGGEIIARNYRCDQGEIDIIARDGATICFVEVKTRRRSSKSRPAEGLSKNQKDRIRKTARRYLAEANAQNAAFRFDLIEIIMSSWDCREFRYWKRNF